MSGRRVEYRTIREVHASLGPRVVVVPFGTRGRIAAIDQSMAATKAATDGWFGFVVEGGPFNGAVATNLTEAEVERVETYDPPRDQPLAHLDVSGLRDETVASLRTLVGQLQTVRRDPVPATTMGGVRAALALAKALANQKQGADRRAMLLQVRVNELFIVAYGQKP